MKIILTAALFVVFIGTILISSSIMATRTERLLSTWQCTVVEGRTSCTKAYLLNNNLTNLISSTFSFLPGLLFAPAAVFSSLGEKIYAVRIITFRPTDWDPQSVPAIQFGILGAGLYYFIFGIIFGYYLNKSSDLRKNIRLIIISFLIIQLFLYALAIKI